METNIIQYYGFLTREEFEQCSCYKINFERFASVPLTEKESGLVPQWKVEDIPNTYPKTLVHAEIELRSRGLDPGGKDYGLSRVLEAGDVKPCNGLWMPNDIDIAMISLAELGCIEPWILTCKGFNVKPADYAKAMRAVVDEHVARIGQHVQLPLFYQFTFLCGKTMQEPGSVSITLRDDIEDVLQYLATSDGRHVPEEN